MTVEQIKAAFIQTDAISGLEPNSMNIEHWAHNNNWSVLFVCQSWSGLPKALTEQFESKFRFVDARVENRVCICLTLEPKKA